MIDDNARANLQAFADTPPRPGEVFAGNHAQGGTQINGNDATEHIDNSGRQAGNTGNQNYFNFGEYPFGYRKSDTPDTSRDRRNKVLIWVGLFVSVAAIVAVIVVIVVYKPEGLGSSTASSASNTDQSPTHNILDSSQSSTPSLDSSPSLDQSHASAPFIPTSGGGGTSSPTRQAATTTPTSTSKTRKAETTPTKSPATTSPPTTTCEFNCASNVACEWGCPGATCQGDNDCKDPFPCDMGKKTCASTRA
ncbi:hypothetical protein PG984_014616 [Apiospora sp. TS-2023a]